LIVVPDFLRLGEWAKEEGKQFSSKLEMVSDPDLHRLIERQVQGPLEGVFSQYEIPKKIGLLITPFTIETGTLTPTQKIKRKAVEIHCKELVEAFYTAENREKMVITERQ